YSQLRFLNGAQTSLGTGLSSGFYLNFDLAAGLPDPNGPNPFWQQPHTWPVATATPGFNSVWFQGTGFPTFADGTFSVSFDPAFSVMSVVYAPVPEPAHLLGLCSAVGGGMWWVRFGRRRWAAETV